MGANNGRDIPKSAGITRAILMIGLILLAAGFVLVTFSVPAGIVVAAAGFILTGSGFILQKKPEYLTLIGW